MSTIPHLTGDKLRGHRFPFPPLSEQDAIATFLDAALANVQDAAEVAEGEIALLREYRIRLIADVVTGKLDVREAAAQLPNEVDEPDPVDQRDDDADDVDDGLLESEEDLEPINA